MSNTVIIKEGDITRSVYIPNAKSANPLVICEHCRWVGRENELIAHQLHPGSCEEPPDIQYTCPDCNREDIRDLEDEEICEGCWDDIIYQEEPDQTHCQDCLVTAAEYMAEPGR